MKLPLVISVAVLASVAIGAPATANQLDYSLNLLFTDPQDDQSGGAWELVARADEQGIAAATPRLTGISNPVFHTPQGEVMGTIVGFEINEVFDFGTHLQLTMTQFPYDNGEQQSLFYDVGVIGGGTMPGAGGTPSFTFDPGTTRNIPWARDDSLGDPTWDGAVLLASGMFAAGTTPDFFASGNDASEGILFGTVGSATMAGEFLEAIVSSVVRDNLMEMTALAGDYNNNGQVEQGDLDLVLLNWGASVATLPPTWTNMRPTTGIVDQVELDGVLLNWGDIASVGSLALGGGGAQGVPEPSTLVLLAAAAITFSVTKHFYRHARRA